jgi:uncharacterized protein YdeI (YjbR/CyaY-like superfamily)
MASRTGAAPVTPGTGGRPLLEPRDRAELHAWLEKNHSSSAGVRLAIGKKGNGVTSLTYEEAVREGLSFGWIDSAAGRLDVDRYTVVFTPRKPGSAWARTNKARVEELDAQGLMAPAGLASVRSAMADGSWTSLDDVEDLVVPRDLADALAARPEAETFFSALGPSPRKLALHRVASAKRQETRARRIAETVEDAAAGRIRNRP